MFFIYEYITTFLTFSWFWVQDQRVTHLMMAQHSNQEVD